MFGRLKPSKELLLPPSLPTYLEEIETLINELDKFSAPLNNSIELDDNKSEHEVPEYSRESIAKLRDSSNSRQLFYHFGIFTASTLGAIVYWFGAEQAIQRYSFGSLEFFKWNAPISVVLTNVFFNERAYLDLLGNTSALSTVKRIVAMIAGMATVAPFFLVGFVGALWQKVLVTISTIFDFPVFYYGALDFYQYFHADFVQQCRWFARCSSENFRIASQKAYLVRDIKRQYNHFVYATKEERALYIEEYQKTDDKLAFMVNKNQKIKIDNSYLAWTRWLLCSGSGLWGLAVIAQDIGHVAVVISGILSIKYFPFWLKILLIMVFAPGNLIPNLGYSFATMANFDFIDFLSVTFFIKVPQAQRVIAAYSVTLSLLVILTLDVLRYLYVTSGGSNDEVNYQGARFLGASTTEATCAGINGNIAMALIYNGVLCERLFTTVMLSIAYTMGDREDKQQIEFEKIFAKLLVKMMIMPIAEVRNMEKKQGFMLTHANYFTSPKNTELMVADTPELSL